MEATQSFSPCSKEDVVPVVSIGSVKLKIIGPKPSSQRIQPPTRFGEDGKLVHEKVIRQTMMKAPDSTCDTLPKESVSISDGEGMPILQFCDGAKDSLGLYDQDNKRKPSTSSRDEEDLPILKVCDDAEHSNSPCHQQKKRKASISPSLSAEMPKAAKKRRANSARPGNRWIKILPMDALENECVPDDAHNSLTSSRTDRQLRRFEKKAPLIHLSSKEIDHDLRLIIGQKRMRRHANRPRKVQEEIKNLFPGMSLPRLIELKRYN